MVEVHFGMEIRIPCLFSAYIAVNRGALQVGGGQYALIFLFYANIAENKNGADDRFLELGCPISPDCDWLCDASDRRWGTATSGTCLGSGLFFVTGRRKSHYSAICALATGSVRRIGR